MPKPDPKYFLWVDLETTGLSHDKDVPLEVAALITTPDLQEIDGCPRFHTLLMADGYAMDRLDLSPIAKEMHVANGLLADIEALGDKAPLPDEVELDFADWIKEHCPEGPIFLAGTGVAAFDIKVIECWFPAVRELLDYRTIDIGQTRRVMKHVLGYSDEQMPAEADSEHRARGDVMNALDQTREIKRLLYRCNPAASPPFHSSPHRGCMLR